MNKRVQKKVAKNLEAKKLASIPVGHGLITGGYNQYHAHPIDTLVKILNVDGKYKIDGQFVACIDESSGLVQTVLASDIKMNL